MLTGGAFIPIHEIGMGSPALLSLGVPALSRSAVSMPIWRETFGW